MHLPVLIGLMSAALDCRLDPVSGQNQNWREYDMKARKPFSVCLICLTRRGGLVNYFIRLANALAEQKGVCAILSHTVPVRHLAPEVVHKPINIGNHGARSTLLRLPAGLLQFIRAVQSLPADVYHITSDQEWNLFIGLVLRAMGKRVIYTVHDPAPHLGAPWHNRLLEKLFRPIPHAYIALCQYSFRLLSAQGIPVEKIALARLGDFFLSEVKASPLQEKIILFQGRWEPYKGLDVLLNAASALLPSFLDWKLVIAGVGSYSPALPAHPQIQFLNHFIPEDEMIALYRNSAFLVLPYIEATQSAIPLMAMAVGRPVVATRVGGLPEVVEHEHTGLLVPPGDPVALKETMQRLMEDEPLRRRLGQNGLEMHRREFSWRQIALDYVEAYKKALY